MNDPIFEDICSEILLLKNKIDCHLFEGVNKMW